MTVYFARAGQDGPIKIGFTAGAEITKSLLRPDLWPRESIGA